MKTAPRRRGRLRWLCISVLLGSALWSTAPYAGLVAGAITPAQVQKIVAGIQVLRGLRFKSKIPISYMNPDQVAKRLKEDLKKEDKSEEIKIDARVGAMLGLYPPNFDLEATTVEMLQNQLGGFYDLRRKDLVIVENAKATGGQATTEQKAISADVIAHELTHGLQDQNFGIGASLTDDKRDDDRSLAMRAVVEGDATLAGFGFIAGRMDDQVLDVFLKHIPDMEKEFMARTRDVPFGVREPFVFQYMAGARFVGEAYHRGGWDAVNALYTKPPESTQQILNPWMYFDRPTPPPPVHLAGYEKVLKDWRKIDGPTLGELLLRTIIQGTLGKDSAYVLLADAWGGDRAAVLTRGKSVTVLWLVVFTNEESAETFATAYAEALDKINRAQTAHRVERNSREVLVMVGDGAIPYRQYLAQVWKDTTVGGVSLARSGSSGNVLAARNR